MEGWMDEQIHGWMDGWFFVVYKAGLNVNENKIKREPTNKNKPMYKVSNFFFLYKLNVPKASQKTALI